MFKPTEEARFGGVQISIIIFKLLHQGKRIDFYFELVDDNARDFKISSYGYTQDSDKEIGMKKTVGSIAIVIINEYYAYSLRKRKEIG